MSQRTPATLRFLQETVGMVPAPEARRVTVEPAPRQRHTHPIPQYPTEAVPGTPAKLKVLERRAGRGEQLFRQGDAQLPRDSSAFGRTLAGDVAAEQDQNAEEGE